MKRYATPAPATVEPRLLHDAARIRPLSRRFKRSSRRPAYASIWVRRNNIRLDRNAATESLKLACDWIIRRSMLLDDQIPAEQNPHAYEYASWHGVVREYDAADRRWTVFGPLWHTGQAMKGLVLAHDLLGDEELLRAAHRGAAFIQGAQIRDPSDPDHGAILGAENGDPRHSATSCMLEALDGLIVLAEHTGQSHLWRTVIDCLTWAQRRLYLPDEGLFLDDFNIQTRHVRPSPNTRLHGVPGRPLLDDGVFLKAYSHGGCSAFERTFFTTAERLLAEEHPRGNWIRFPPCDSVAGLIHPRQAYWWGRPMVLAWQASGRRRYLDCAKRAADWYVRAQRADGGMFRATAVDFSTTSFDQATSGILCAACLWGDLIAIGQGDAYRDPLRCAIQFGSRVQFTHPSDPNLHGAVLESMTAPEGTDRLPLNVRDLATIFYIQSLAMALKNDLLQ